MRFKNFSSVAGKCIKICMNTKVFIINFNHEIDHKSINKHHKSISFKM